MDLILLIIALLFQDDIFQKWAGSLVEAVRDLWLSLSLSVSGPPALSFSGLPPCGPVPLRVTLSALVALGASDQVWRESCVTQVVSVFVWVSLYLPFSVSLSCRDSQ